MKLLWRTAPKPRPGRLAVFGLTAGLLGGGAAGLLVTGTTLASAQPARGPGGKGGRHGLKNLDAAAQALGMSVVDLRTALQGGKSLAAIAGEKGVPVAAVVDALVTPLKAHLDQHVASGKNTQAEADQLLANARTRIEAFVNGTAPAGGPGFGFGKGGRHGRGPGTAPSASSSASSGTTVS